MSATEIDVLKRSLPLQNNLSLYTCIKTKVNYYDDLEFRLATGLDSLIQKFGHFGWREMKPMIVGIKCYTSADTASVFVLHTNRDGSKRDFLEAFDVENDTWQTFKYPLFNSPSTETRIQISEGVTAFTLAVLDTSLRVRHDHNINDFPRGYESFDRYNTKTIVYRNEAGVLFNPSGAALAECFIIDPIEYDVR
jgi:hypothetical protein